MKNKQDIYEKKRELKEGEGLAPQPTLILKLLEKGPMERSKLVAAIEKKLGDTTVQKGTTILSFWKKPLIERGLVTVKRVDVEK